MALSPQDEDQSPSSLLDALYCEEEQWEEEEEEEEVEDQDHDEQVRVRNSSSSLPPLLLLEQDLFWEDEELLSLFFKEKQASSKQGSFDRSLSSARKEAVEWILKVNAHYGFCPLTSILAVNYLDRFLSSFHCQNDKPWMFQLAAVTCLSIAAKVEETHVPLLLDLQVCQLKFLFFFNFTMYWVFSLKSLRNFTNFSRWRGLSMCLKLKQFRKWSFWCCQRLSGR